MPLLDLQSCSSELIFTTGIWCFRTNYLRLLQSLSRLDTASAISFWSFTFWVIFSRQKKSERKKERAKDTENVSSFSVVNSSLLIYAIANEFKNKKIIQLCFISRRNNLHSDQLSRINSVLFSFQKYFYIHKAPRVPHTKALLLSICWLLSLLFFSPVYTCISFHVTFQERISTNHPSDE